MRRPIGALLVRWCTASLILLAMAGCSSNERDPLLTPTGIRPLPAHLAGGLEGFIRHDSTIYAGLSGAPYPPTVVTLLKGDSAVGADTIAADRRGFRFVGLAPGRYTLLARSHAFRPASLGPVQVREEIRDAGDIPMSAASESLQTIVLVIGQMPGFTEAEIFSFETAMDANTLGLWSYPNSFAAARPVAAGTYRFKFLTDLSSSGGQWIGWGGDSNQVLTAPVTDRPVRFGFGSSTDLKVSFPTSGLYEFTFDERRLTFSVRLASPSPTLRSHRRPLERSNR